FKAVGNLGATSQGFKKLVNHLNDVYNIDEVYDPLLGYLNLPKVQGDRAFVGLYILLTGAQFELRDMIIKFRNWMRSGENGRESMALKYPDLFTGRIPQPKSEELLANPWSRGDYMTKWVDLGGIKHGLFQLGKQSKIGYIITVVKMFLRALNSEDLLKNFEIIGGLAPHEQGLNHQARPATVATSPRDVRVSTYQFWLEAIGSNDVKRLRYYLTNMLLFNVVPLIISQVLHRNQEEALALVNDLMQLPDFIKFTQADPFKTDPLNAPNYFEFIVMHEIRRKPPGYEAFINRYKPSVGVCCDDDMLKGQSYLLTKRMFGWTVF
ncbi:hypothetical protein H4R34_004378, partial [Dimargaris verticillata]